MKLIAKIFLFIVCLLFWAVQFECTGLYLLMINSIGKIFFVSSFYFLLRNFYDSLWLRVCVITFCIVMLNPFLGERIITLHPKNCSTSYVSYGVDIYFLFLTGYIFISLLTPKLA